MNLEAGSRTVIDSAARIGPVELIVGSLARSRRFYVDTLGLEVVESQRRRQAFAVAGSSDPIVILREQPGVLRRPTMTNGLYHFAILVPSRPDLARVLRRLAETGHLLDGASDHLVSEALYLSDPDGLGVEIYRDRPSTGWVWADGEVAMDNRPIDFTNLLSELGEDADWSGMPPGTRIGHMHLHVPDLAEASRFYVDLLGFQVVSRMPGALFVSAGRYHHHIALNTWAGRNTAPANSAGLDHFEIRLPNAVSLANLTARLNRAGAALDEEFDGVLTHDPFGNRISFASER